MVVQTVRTGTHTLHVQAENAESVRELLRSECEAGLCDCPPDCCTDDVESAVVEVRQISKVERQYC